MAFEVISRKYFIGFCATRSWLVGSHVTLGTALAVGHV